jgi:hypothetical protein
MKNPERKPFSDDALDALLRSRLRDTTPEFEARWVDFRRRLRTAPAHRHPLPVWTAAWLGIMSAGVTMAAIVLALHPWRPSPSIARTSALSPQLDELFTLDAALEPAAALLDGENRDALLNLPVQPPSHT